MSNVAGKQSIGQRETQEDAFVLEFQDEQDPGSDLLMVLADGMGGQAAGEIAAQLTCKVFARYFIAEATARRPRKRLEEAMQAANAAVAERIAADPSLAGMGCTLIGALKIDDRLSWISIGDSRLYLLRNGSLLRLNADHSVHGELIDLVEAGKLSRAEADRHPKKHALRSAITGRPPALVDLEAASLEPGDLVVAATDGLDVLGTGEIKTLLSREARPDVRALCSDLLNAVEAKGLPNQDNTTVIAYRHSGTGRTSSSPGSTWSGQSGTGGRGSDRRTLGLIGAAVAVVALMVAMVWVTTRPTTPPGQATPQAAGGDPAPERAGASQSIESAQDAGTVAGVGDGDGGAGAALPGSRVTDDSGSIRGAVDAENGAPISDGTGPSAGAPIDSEGDATAPAGSGSADTSGAPLETDAAPRRPNTPISDGTGTDGATEIGAAPDSDTPNAEAAPLE